MVLVACWTNRKDHASFAAVLLWMLAIVDVVHSELSQSRIGDLSNPDNQRIQLVESERVLEYHRRNYTWPVQKYVPDTPGWKALMDERFARIAEIPDSGPRYQAYISTINPALLAPNFTEHGFGLARCPEELTRALRKGIRDGLPTARTESTVSLILGPEPPLFVDRPDLTDRVLHELQHYAETWAGMELTPYRAYGFRLYRNESALMMHVDKIQTHIISFILHIDSSDDAEPWPIYIEDYHGNTHEVILTSGDILFYESSKCFHGRPKKFNGSWYSSLFVHYYPKHDWYDMNHMLEAHYAVPPSWSEQPQGPPKEKRLRMIGTSFQEPDCINDYCRSENTVQWSGPGEEGYWIAPNGQRYPFNPKLEVPTASVATSMQNDEL